MAGWGIYVFAVLKYGLFQSRNRPSSGIGFITIRSEQDTDDYASKQQQLGMKGVIGYGGSASVSYNQSKVDSHYQSVTAVSGIAAGSGGFDITVGGNTHLAGGVIASAAEASKNRLDTGSLTYEHVKNEADYSASSIGLNAGYGSGSFSASPALGMPQSGHSSSETKAGVAQGTIIVRDGNADLSGLDRNPTLDDQTLKPIFDAQKVQEQMEMGQLMGQVGMRAAGDIAGKMGWPEGSPERTLLHGLVGVGMAAMGGGDVTQAVLGAGANQLVIQKMAEFLESQGYEKGTPEFATMLQLGSAAIGAAVGEGSGAAAALAGTQYNYLTHLQQEQKEKELAKCGSDAACKQHAEDHWNDISAQQSVAMYESLTPGSYSPSLSQQLANMDPHAPEFDKLLAQAVAQGGLADSQLFKPSEALSWLYSTDGLPSMGAMPPGMSLEDRNKLEQALLGPVFDLPGNIAQVAGASPQQVAAANEVGALELNVTGSLHLEPLIGQSEGVIASEPWTTPAINAGINWGEGIQNQGMPWENYLANQLPPGSQLPPNFKTFDFYDPTTQTAISAKTLDTMGSSYLDNSKKVYATLEKYIDSAASFKGYELSGKELNPSMITARELRVAVPAQTTSQQWEQINQAIQYGESQGVKVLVTSVQ